MSVLVTVCINTIVVFKRRGASSFGDKNEGSKCNLWSISVTEQPYLQITIQVLYSRALYWTLV